MKPSPGPWRVHFGRLPSVYAADGRSVLSAGNARSRTADESLADATLAAAAPDLLMWAKDLLKHLDRSRFDVDTTDSVRMLCKAIAKAEGKVSPRNPFDDEPSDESDTPPLSPVCMVDACGKPAAFLLGMIRTPACNSCAQRVADFHAEHGDTTYPIVGIK